jgi:glycosyltransferase 2 family protein
MTGQIRISQHEGGREQARPPAVVDRGRMSRSRWLRVAQALAGVAVLVVLVVRLGTGPFLAGLRTISAGPVAAALALTAVTTVCAAWRWRLVASGLGLALPLRAAVAAYYRSQFLNTALPGGVLGDVHRAIAHGRDTGGRIRAARAVVWERLAGQVVQIALAVLVLAALPSPLPNVVPVVAAIAVVGIVGAAVLLGRRAHRTHSRIARIAGVVGEDMRAAVLARQAWPGIALSSMAVVMGHLALFLVAARTAGVSVPVDRLLPLAMLVLVATALPANVGGWGVREGAAAWVFGAAGLGAAQGLATATVYGVLVMAATLPGAVLLVTPRLLRRPRGPVPEPPQPKHLEPVGSAAGGSVRG